MSWRDEAACRGSDHRLFFGPESEPAGTKRRREDRAKTVCAGCPVTRECLAYAITAPEKWGVYGGTGERERRYIRRSYMRRALQAGTVRA